MLKQIFSPKIILSVALFCLFANPKISAQVDNIPANHPVYNFLKRMSVSGILKDYDDIIIPMSREKVLKYLSELDTSSAVSGVDREFLNRMKEKLELPLINKNTINVFDNFPDDFTNNLISDNQKHLYYYQDSSINFFIDPVLGLKYLYSNKQNRSSTLFNFGGIARGSYDGWLGFYVQGTNGIVYGNRHVAEIDRRVKQSYTFNNTGLNNFDGTEGYIRLKKGIVNFELGRERILWGNGYIDKTILSSNAQMFDFIKFGISYKKFRYDFIHGWLVQKPDTIYLNPLTGNVKYKYSKYIAISRLGYQANSRLNLGISQMVIYANRPFEAAYLNPFLFWESAQRSLNDLDNSFLTFDGRYLITPGCEVSASIIFDDLNFKKLFHHNGWNASNNSNEWQAGTMLAWPLLPEELSIKFQYTQNRPYMFSHPGIGESLTYTNNGYLLGTNLQPNSTRFSAEADYRLSSKINLKLNYSRTLHGANIYDQNGTLVRNVGGNVFENFALGDSDFSYLLDGNRELDDEFSVYVNYEITYGYYFDFVYRLNHYKQNNLVTNENIFWTTFCLSFE